MKSHSLLLSVAALAILPACTNQNMGRYSDRSYPNEPQYLSHDQESKTSYPDRDISSGHGMGMDDSHGHWKDDRLEAMVDHFFDKADTNHSGVISRKEFNAFMNRKFTEMDTNHDGKLTRQEVRDAKRQEWKDLHHEMRSDMGRDDDNDRGHHWRHHDRDHDHDMDDRSENSSDDRSMSADGSRASTY